MTTPTKSEDRSRSDANPAITVFLVSTPFLTRTTCGTLTSRSTVPLSHHMKVSANPSATASHDLISL